MMTQEFHISVTPVGNDEYLVRTEEVASGVPLAEEQVSWPVEAWLGYARQLMQDPLLGVLEGQTLSRYRSRGVNTASKSAVSPESSLISLVELGRQLYNGLFQGTMRESWTCAQAIAQNRREFLHLRLGVKGKRLTSLPWEVLYAGDRPIGTGPDVGFSRYQPGGSSHFHSRLLTSNQPLKILVAISAPNDQESLQLKREVLHLQEELQRDTQRSSERIGSRPEIQLTILEQPDGEQLTQALEQGQYQVFHYAGHSNLGVSGGELYLVSSRTGLTETLSGDDLAGLLVNNGVQMAVLNSCRGAYAQGLHSDEDTAQLNLAESLVRRGIPGVLAMAERIPDEVALTLTRLLYRNLNQGHPVDISLSRARQGLISAYGSHQLYWGLPILYLHRKFDGYLTADSSESQRDLFAPISTQNWGESSLPPVEKETEKQEQVPVEEEIDLFLDEIEYGDDLAEDGEDLEFIGDALRQLKSSQPSSETINNIFVEKPEHISPVKTSTVSPTTAVKTSNFPARKQPNFNTLKSWLPLALLLIPMSLGMGLFYSSILQFGKSQPEISLSKPTKPHSTEANSTNEQPLDLNSAKSDYVLGIAVEQFHKGNLLAGVQATTELLNRGAITEAKSALAAVPVEDSDRPEINFLWGRLMWQAINQGSADYMMDDVRRYWERAVQQRPDALEYRNALGFAYYSEGSFDKAYQTWLQVLDLEEPAFNEKAVQQQLSKVQGENKPQILTAYAGLGLVLMKSTAQLPPAEQAVRLSKAVKFCDKVLSEAPEEFKPHLLSQNWLWTNAIIRDWRLLMRQQN
ncbi:CHAT domain-containing protein [Limnoraphis robusta Tam1]|nr:CHAT domain-containing protein [Limnoraphis robusta]MEA5501248.1 CHAT domain-containing protein [Limnoraphis robusta BA-68 BA1]MEA5539237.1 CHAT domain-containing protein [Limnoraphis robusta Tam1]